VLALPNLDSQELRQDLGGEEMLSPFLSGASGGQHQPALIIHGGSHQRKLSRLHVSGTNNQSALGRLQPFTADTLWLISTRQRKNI
jgi:hypothetical protein